MSSGDAIDVQHSITAVPGISQTAHLKVLSRDAGTIAERGHRLVLAVMAVGERTMEGGCRQQLEEQEQQRRPGWQRGDAAISTARWHSSSTPAQP